MAYVHRDPSYAPCGFLIVPTGGNPRGPDTVLVQTDFDFPALASRLGFVPCDCGATDGTVDCEHRTASEMISAAYDYLVEHAGEESAELDDYFG